MYFDGTAFPDFTEYEFLIIVWEFMLKNTFSVVILLFIL